MMKEPGRVVLHVRGYNPRVPDMIRAAVWQALKPPAAGTSAPERPAANAPPTRPGHFFIPQTFVVAADGHVVLRVRGYHPRVVEMIRAGVRKALELSPAPAAAPAAGGRP